MQATLTSSSHLTVRGMLSTRDRFREIRAAAPSGAARKKHPGKAVLAGK